jgi:Flp pilus assembly CpaF family ATPase
MVLSGDARVPAEIVGRQVRSAFDLVVHLARRADGRRSIESIVEVGDAGERSLVVDGCFTT